MESLRVQSLIKLSLIGDNQQSIRFMSSVDLNRPICLSVSSRTPGLCCPLISSHRKRVATSTHALRDRDNPISSPYPFASHALQWARVLPQKRAALICNTSRYCDYEKEKRSSDPVTNAR